MGLTQMSHNVRVMRIAERTLTLDECRAERFEPFQKIPFDDGLDVQLLAAKGIRNVLVLDLVGAFDGPDTHAFSARVRQLVYEGEHTIVVNLAAVTKWDSTGLGE